jgi:hypothetical protein
MKVTNVSAIVMKTSHHVNLQYEKKVGHPGIMD